MAVKNHLLSSEIFFQQIRRETADLDNLRATLSTIQATWQYYLPPPKEWQGAWAPVRLLQVGDEVLLRELASPGDRNYVCLDPAGRNEGPLNARWRLIVNVPKRQLQLSFG
jgi:hypothetical protein